MRRRALLLVLARGFRELRCTSCTGRLAIALAVAYFVRLFRSFAGKVAPGGSDHGY